MRRASIPTGTLTVSRGAIRCASYKPASSYVFLLAAALMASRVALAGHMLFVPHVPCPHGKLIHRVSTGQSNATVTARHIRDQVVLSQDAANRNANAHKHCDMVAVNEALTDLRQPALLQGIISWLLDVPSSGRAAGESIPNLSLAPKTTPPTRSSYS